MRKLISGYVWRPVRRAVTLAGSGRLSPLRPPVALLRFRLLVHRIRQGLAPLRAAPDPAALDLAMMERLIRAWGHPGWTGDAGFLLEVARSVWQGRGPVLDCGSGLSTVVGAVMAARQGATVWSLEQDARRHAEIRRILSALHLANVVLWHVPLRSFDDYVWYDLEGRNFPSRFGTVVCDGPAIRRREWPPALYRQWRAGALPALREQGILFDSMLVADADDPRAPALRSRWTREGLRLDEIVTPAGRYLVGRNRARLA